MGPSKAGGGGRREKRGEREEVARSPSPPGRGVAGPSLPRPDPGSGCPSPFLRLKRGETAGKAVPVPESGAVTGLSWSGEEEEEAASRPLPLRLPPPLRTPADAQNGGESGAH